MILSLLLLACSSSTPSEDEPIVPLLPAQTATGGTGDTGTTQTTPTVFPENHIRSIASATFEAPAEAAGSSTGDQLSLLGDRLYVSTSSTGFGQSSSYVYQLDPLTLEQNAATRPMGGPIVMQVVPDQDLLMISMVGA